MDRTDSDAGGRLSHHPILPVVLTSFVGRKREIAEITRLLASTPLVSLVGVGGCGKTRLALHVAEELRDHYLDGVYWVDLTPLLDPMLVPQVVAKVFNVVEHPKKPLIDMLLDWLRNRHLLLILDNCEHPLDGCVPLVEALIRSPTIKLLTTSREPLGVVGETLYPVLPLTLPATPLPVDEIAHIDAIQLFVERVRLLPDFVLTPDNAETIATICRDLDGLPLAIELASARVKLLSIKQIQARLQPRRPNVPQANSSPCQCCTGSTTPTPGRPRAFAYG